MFQMMIKNHLLRLLLPVVLCALVQGQGQEVVQGQGQEVVQGQGQGQQLINGQTSLDERRIILDGEELENLASLQLRRQGKGQRRRVSR